MVAAKPQSARAHYVYAQILAHNGRFNVADAEETRARHLDLAMKFSNAEDVRAGMLAERLLERGHEQRGSDPCYGGSSAGSSLPDPDARALEDRSIDFGAGNDWGDGGGSSDVGGGSDDASW